VRNEPYPCDAINLLDELDEVEAWRACGVIGMTMQQAWEVIWRLSSGSVPKLRRTSLEVMLQEAARPSQQPPESAQIDFSGVSQGLGRPQGADGS
jgi:hypothetical protein